MCSHAHSIVYLCCREKKRCSDFRNASDEYKRRLEAALKEQRTLVRRVGEAERAGGGQAHRLALRTKLEDDLWSEEAGRRFAQQQEELVTLREVNQELEEKLSKGEGCV